MKFKLLLVTFSFSFIIVSAQKQSYLFFAAAQHFKGGGCGEKAAISTTVVSLTEAEAAGYRLKEEQKLKLEYKLENNYRNLRVELVNPWQFAILYSAELKKEFSKDGWDCTSTWYGIVIAADEKSAEKAFEKIKEEDKRTKFSKTQQWGKTTM